MIKHIVFWQIKDELEKQIVMPKMKQMLTSLVGKIDGLVSAEVGFNYIFRFRKQGSISNICRPSGALSC